MKCIAKGILYHHFWGEYSAEIYLDWNSPWQAKQAARILGPKWKFQNATCGIHASEDELDAIEAKLISLGADEGKIGSVETSIDHGEPFEICMELEHPDQIELKLT